MLQRVKYLLFTLAGIAAALTAAAQQIVFEVHVPRVVAAGEMFRVEFSANAAPETFNAPQIDGFEMLAGPSRSEGTSISVVNGNMTKSTNVTYTYVLVGNETGKFAIGAAEAVIDGKTYRTHPVTVEVVDAGTQPNTSQPATGTATPAATSIAQDDILIRVLVDKTSVYKGQPIRATFKLYTRLPMSGVESAKYPAFNGFWSQELNTDSYRWQRETYNGKIYDSRVIREYLLFPQQAGTLYIERFDLTVIAQLVTQSRRQSIIDDFFNGGPDVQEVRRKISAAPVRIDVKELPAGAPESFTGAVGRFSMETDLPDSKLAANSSATYSITVSGSGNLPLIQAPKLTLPASFEQYNIKTTESLKNTTGGISGYRRFEYPFIARAQGSYTVDPIDFTYFDPQTVKYVTLSTPPLQLEIMPDSSDTAAGRGLVGGLTKEDLKILGQDIRFIKINSPGLKNAGSLFMFSPAYFIVMGTLLLLFVLTLLYLQKRIRELRNTALVKGKRANKVALQRLRAAAKYMQDENPRGFYEEMLRALWGYMGDKLNIPVANLTKENVREELLRRGVAADLAGQYIGIITDCEYAQYAPTGSGAMQDVYASAVGTISKLESIINR